MKFFVYTLKSMSKLAAAFSALCKTFAAAFLLAVRDYTDQRDAAHIDLFHPTGPCKIE